MYEPQGGGTCLIQSPRPLGTSSGATKNHRNICTISGTLRNTSTYVSPARTTQGSGVVRSVPMIEPSASAMIQAASAVASVQPRPTTR